MDKTISNGDYILIVYGDKGRWLVQVKEGETFHTNKGHLAFNSIIGKPYGTSILSSKGNLFQIFAPTPADFLLKTIRKTQIIYPKDAAFILLQTGIGPGSRVVEAGAGSGGLTSVLAYYVRPTGKIYSYEINAEFYKKAKKTLERTQLRDFVELKLKDINEGIDEEHLDAVVLDLPQPWDIIDSAKKALKNGGLYASLSPTIIQVQTTVDLLRAHNFGDIRTYELLLRPWKISVRKGNFLATRPQTQMIGHSGFLTFARKLCELEESADNS
ncbi:MAG: tRNA (adenine-N1)-methyltransferase [Candidatus Helarchaeota archaeon]